jgi:hypothetical protein
MTNELNQTVTDYLIALNTAMVDANLKMFDANVKMATAFAQQLNIHKVFESFSRR